MRRGVVVAVAASVLLVLTVVLQALSLLVLPELGSLAAETA